MLYNISNKEGVIMSYLETLYNKLAENLNIEELPTIDRKEDDYGDALARMDNTLWAHCNRSRKTDGVAYISEIGLSKNIIQIYYNYWVRWTQVPVTLKDVNAVTAWSHRCTSSGLVIPIEITANDDEYNPHITINIYDKNCTATCQLCAKDESLYYIDGNNEEHSYRNWLYMDNLISYDGDISNMKNEALRALIKYIGQAVKHLYYNIIGEGSEYNDYDDDIH